jgi:predicted nucleic acid-binding protein
MTFLCDTNVISELARPQPNSGVMDWIATVPSISLSVITLEEILYEPCGVKVKRINTLVQFGVNR